MPSSVPRTRRAQRWIAATALLITPLAVGLPDATAAPTITASTGWRLTTTSTSGDYAPTFVGNGYLAARVPAAGEGFSSTPIVTQSELAGFYASSSPNAGETRASLPTWTTLGVGDGTSTYGVTLPVPCEFNQLCPAPDGQLSGGAVLASDHSGSTSGSFVAGFANSDLSPNVGATATLTVHDAPAGDATVAVRYANSSGDTQTGTIVVNGTATQVQLPNLNNWDTWGIAHVQATLTAGTNTVAVTTAQSDSGRFNLDAVAAYPTDGTTPTKACDFNQLCPAPYGQLSGGAKLANDHSGSTSGSFVAGFANDDLSPDVGASATLSVNGAPAGPATIGVRYANSTGSTQTGTVVVNGTATQVQLPNLNSWDTWAVAEVPATLTEGTNTVAVTTAQGDSGRFNLDAIAAYPTGSPTPTSTVGGSGSTSNYRQTLDMRAGTLTTSFDWTAPTGRVSHLVYTVLADQGSTHLGQVNLAITPQWSGTATVYDEFDGHGLDHATTANAKVNGAKGLLTEDSVTTGGLVTAALASLLDVGDKAATTTAIDNLSAGTAGQQTSFPVTAGKTYQVTKFVGIASTVDTDRTLSKATPQHAAGVAATAGAKLGHDGVIAQNKAAWSALWASDITVPGNTAMTASARAAMFYLLESSRAGVNWSPSPGGLSSDGYNGHVFWDADTWMYPGLLAQHPEVANTMNTYRQNRLAAAEKIAKAEGYKGAKFPWESALSGEESIPPGNPEGDQEIHIDSDIALAQWEYYQASGDKTWLRKNAYPVLKGVADFWASRAHSDGKGKYSINDVQGPDEYHTNVDNEAYTNVSARKSLQLATLAAQTIGVKPTTKWQTVADGLKMPTVDPTTGAYLEYDGYTTGTQVKQADVTMLQYPWAYPMSTKRKQANLDYYTQNTDLGGPSMTDSIASIDASAIGAAGCSAYTYLQRSSTPFLTQPFDQMQETRTGGAFTFTTAEGGYLQEFLYGFTGMRYGRYGVVLDPSLPSQLPGVDLTGLKWQGRTFDVKVGPKTTTVTLHHGATLPVSLGGHIHDVRRGKTLSIATRNPGVPSSSNRALCASTTATSADPSYPAVAAVDGSNVTAWHATEQGASLTVDLGKAVSLHEVDVLSDGPTTDYTILASSDGSSYLPVASQNSQTGSSTTNTTLPVTARYLRYVAGSDATAKVDSITVK